MTGVLTWRYLTEYARRPLNLVLLAIVPIVFVALSAGALADFARILGGEAGIGQLEAVTAGWAAAFLAGVAGFFHVTGSRGPDRRLAAAGSKTGRVVTARVTSSLLLAAVAAAGALIALAVRTGVIDIGRAVGSTAMFAVIYLGALSITCQPMADERQPIACSLPARESRDQIGEWRALIDHRKSTEPVKGGYAVTYDPGVTTVVQDLARRESACCGFLDIVTTPTENGVRMVMTSDNPDALPVIELLIGNEDAID